MRWRAFRARVTWKSLVPVITPCAIWLNPDKLAARNLTASDVVDAIREQNVQVAGGIIGAPPVDRPVNYEMQVNVKGRLISTEEFGNIVVKVGTNGERRFAQGRRPD